MFISSAMSAVVTCGSPSRLKSESAVSTILSRVRRGSFLGIGASAPRLALARAAQRRERVFEMRQREVEIALDRAHGGALGARMQRTRIGERVLYLARRVGQPVLAQREPVAREH